MGSIGFAWPPSMSLNSLDKSLTTSASGDRSTGAEAEVETEIKVIRIAEMMEIMEITEAG